MPRSLRTVATAAIFVASVWVVTARARSGSDDADVQLQLATLLFDETRYWEALDAFERAQQSDDAVLALRARKGRVRTALRVAEFGLARREAQGLKEQAPRDSEAL